MAASAAFSKLLPSRARLPAPTLSASSHASQLARLPSFPRSDCGFCLGHAPASGIAGCGRATVAACHALAPADAANSSLVDQFLEKARELSELGPSQREHTSLQILNGIEQLPPKLVEPRRQDLVHVLSYVTSVASVAEHASKMSLICSLAGAVEDHRPLLRALMDFEETRYSIHDIIQSLASQVETYQDGNVTANLGTAQGTLLVYDKSFWDLLVEIGVQLSARDATLLMRARARLSKHGKQALPTPALWSFLMTAVRQDQGALNLGSLTGLVWACCTVRSAVSVPDWEFVVDVLRPRMQEMPPFHVSLILVATANNMRKSEYHEVMEELTVMALRCLSRIVDDMSPFDLASTMHALVRLGGAKCAAALPIIVPVLRKQLPHIEAGSLGSILNSVRTHGDPELIALRDDIMAHLAAAGHNPKVLGLDKASYALLLNTVSKMTVQGRDAALQALLEPAVDYVDGMDARDAAVTLCALGRVPAQLREPALGAALAILADGAHTLSPLQVSMTLQSMVRLGRQASLPVLSAMSEAAERRCHDMTPQQAALTISAMQELGCTMDTQSVLLAVIKAQEFGQQSVASMLAALRKLSGIHKPEVVNEIVKIVEAEAPNMECGAICDTLEELAFMKGNVADGVLAACMQSLMACIPTMQPADMARAMGCLNRLKNLEEHTHVVERVAEVVEDYLDDLGGDQLVTVMMTLCKVHLYSPLCERVIVGLFRSAARRATALQLHSLAQLLSSSVQVVRTTDSDMAPALQTLVNALVGVVELEGQFLDQHSARLMLEACHKLIAVDTAVLQEVIVMAMQLQVRDVSASQVARMLHSLASSDPHVQRKMLPVLMERLDRLVPSISTQDAGMALEALTLPAYWKAGFDCVPLPGLKDMTLELLKMAVDDMENMDGYVLMTTLRLLKDRGPLARAGLHEEVAGMQTALLPCILRMLEQEKWGEVGRLLDLITPEYAGAKGTITDVLARRLAENAGLLKAFDAARLLEHAGTLGPRADNVLVPAILKELSGGSPVRSADIHRLVAAACVDCPRAEDVLTIAASMLEARSHSLTGQEALQILESAARLSDKDAQEQFTVMLVPVFKREWKKMLAKEQTNLIRALVQRNDEHAAHLLPELMPSYLTRVGAMNASDFSTSVRFLATSAQYSAHHSELTDAFSNRALTLCSSFSMDELMSVLPGAPHLLRVDVMRPLQRQLMQVLATVTDTLPEKDLIHVMRSVYSLGEHLELETRNCFAQLVASSTDRMGTVSCAQALGALRLFPRREREACSIVPVVAARVLSIPVEKLRARREVLFYSLTEVQLLEPQAETEAALKHVLGAFTEADGGVLPHGPLCSVLACLRRLGWTCPEDIQTSAIANLQAATERTLADHAVLWVWAECWQFPCEAFMEHLAPAKVTALAVLHENKDGPPMAPAALSKCLQALATLPAGEERSTAVAAALSNLHVSKDNLPRTLSSAGLVGVADAVVQLARAGDESAAVADWVWDSVREGVQESSAVAVAAAEALAAGACSPAAAAALLPVVREALPAALERQSEAREEEVRRAAATVPGLRPEDNAGLQM